MCEEIRTFRKKKNERKGMNVINSMKNFAIRLRAQIEDAPRND